MNEIQTAIEQVETCQIGVTPRNQKTAEESLNQVERTNWGILFLIVAQTLTNIGFLWGAAYLLGRVDGLRESISRAQIVKQFEQQQGDTDPVGYYHVCQDCNTKWFGPPPPPNGWVHCPVCSAVRFHPTSRSNEQLAPPSPKQRTSTSDEKTKLLHSVSLFPGVK